MSRLTRDGTAEAVLQDQTLRHERVLYREMFIFPVEFTMSRIGNHTRLISSSLVIIIIIINTLILFA